MRRGAVSTALFLLACVVATALFLLICGWKFPAPRCGFVEDTYISFRYARNLAEGNGLVWNVGEKPVEGFTNLLWVVELAGTTRWGMFQKAGAEPEEVAGRFLGLGHGVVTIAALALTALILSRRRYRWLALVVPSAGVVHVDDFEDVVPQLPDAAIPRAVAVAVRVAQSLEACLRHRRTFLARSARTI